MNGRVVAFAQNTSRMAVTRGGEPETLHASCIRACILCAAPSGHCRRHVFDVAFLCPGRYERARAALRPRQGHPHREAERFSRIRAPDHVLCVGHAVARSPGGPQPILHSGDGSRWPRRNCGIVAYEQFEGVWQISGCLRASSTSRRPQAAIAGTCRADKPCVVRRSFRAPCPRLQPCSSEVKEGLQHMRRRSPARKHREDGKAMQPHRCASNISLRVEL